MRLPTTYAAICMPVDDADVMNMQSMFRNKCAMVYIAGTDTAQLHTYLFPAKVS